MTRTGLLGFALLASAAYASAEPPTLTPLPDGFIPLNISDDGALLVGYSTGPAVPMIWSRERGVEQILGPSGEPLYGKCFAASADGAFVVGTVIYAGLQTPFRWSRAAGIEFPNPTARGNAYDVSADGAVLVGDAGTTDQAPGFVWSASGYLNLEAPDPLQGGTVTCISADGNIAAGVASGASTGVFARWALDSLSCETLTLDEGVTVPLLGYVNDMNAEGSVLIGIADDGMTGVRPILWTPNQYRFLGPAGGVARRASRDARMVAGSTAAAGGSAWISTLGVGPTNLREYLHNFHGFDCPEGATFSQIFGVSGDGRTLCGWGAPHHWLLELPPAIPSDFNLDETSDFFDIIDFLDCFEGVGLLPPSAADFNHDGITDFFDLAEFLGE